MANRTKEPIETDILCVGAGVASLSTALALVRTLKAEGGTVPRITVLDKGRGVGSHVLSGAVIDMSGFKGLLTEDEIKRMPVEARVTKESFHMLFNKNRAMRIPWVPPMMQAHDYPVGSLTKLTRYLADLCRAEGIEVFPGFAVTELIENARGRVIGARIGDKGVDREGNPKSNFTPGEEIFAKVVVLGEGACGILTDRLIARKGLSGKRPQSYAIGVKEVIEVPPDASRTGEILHTFGFPADWSTYGGGFVYHMAENQVLVCYAYALDYAHAEIDPHQLFRKFKSHPVIMEHIKGGKAVAYGAKVIPEGGYYSVPRMVADGVLIVGDGAGLVDTLRIKGIHIAAHSGRAAATTLAECWKRENFTLSMLERYEKHLKKTTGWQELKRVKNVRAPFSTNLILGVMSAGAAWATFGKFPFWQVPMEEDYKAMLPLKGGRMPEMEEIQVTPTSPDRLTDVYMSGTIHDEDQPCHLKILDRKLCEQCIKVYGAPCQRFCPAEVYRLEDNHIHIDFSNCVHCKTCQIKDPYQNIQWDFPQGGDGPRYTRM